MRGLAAPARGTVEPALHAPAGRIPVGSVSATRCHIRDVRRRGPRTESPQSILPPGPEHGDRRETLPHLPRHAGADLLLGGAHGSPVSRRHACACGAGHGRAHAHAGRIEFLHPRARRRAVMGPDGYRGMGPESRRVETGIRVVAEVDAGTIGDWDRNHRTGCGDDQDPVRNGGGGRTGRFLRRECPAPRWRYGQRWMPELSGERAVPPSLPRRPGGETAARP